MNKKKPTALSNVTERDKKLLFLLGAILILAVSYFFVFSPNQKKADEVKAENREFSAYVVELDEKIAHEEEKKSEILTFNNNRDAILEKFPSGMTHEKAIAILAELEDETDIFSSQVTLAVNNIFFNQTEAVQAGTVQIETEDVASTSSVAVEGVSTEEYPALMGYKTTLTIAFTCTDAELTAALDFINGYSDKMSVETITVGYDETSGNLTGTMNLCMFSVDSSKNEYKAPENKDVKLGVANIFGSKEVKSAKKKK